MDPLSVSEAAGRLGVSPRRVRALIRAGRLPAVRVGRVWGVAPAGLERFPRAPGRPVAAGNAWALLALLAGVEPGWVHPSIRSRLRRRLADPLWVEQALQRSEPRSRICRWRFLPGDLPAVAEDLVLSGLAAELGGFDVVPLRPEVDGYLDAGLLRRLRDRFRPSRSPSEPNALLRVPSHPWILEQGRVAPAAVAAADLLDHDDPRVSRAARDLLRRHVR